MRIFNEDKTAELTEVDYEKGYLKADKLFIAHHEAIPFKRGRTAQEIAEELKAQGISVETGYEDMLYRVVKEYESGGCDTEPIEDEPDIEAQEAYDDYEDIQVYIPYTAEQLNEHELSVLRNKRETLLVAFDKWEKAVLRGRELDDECVMDWYQFLLDLKETAFDNIPERIKYYL